MPSFNVIRPLVAPFAVVSAVALLSHYPELVTAQGQLHTPPKSTNVFTQAKGGGDFGRSTAVNAARVREMKEMLAAESKLESGAGSSAAAAVLTSNKSTNGKEVDDVTKAAVRLATAATGKYSILDEINEVTSIVDRKSFREFEG